MLFCRVDSTITDWLMSASEVIVIEHRVRDLFGRADQSGRIALRAAERRDTRPQALVDAVALVGGVEEPLRAGVRWRVTTDCNACRLAEVAHLLDDLVGLFPCRFFGISDHRAQRQREAGIATIARGGVADRADRLAHLRLRLAPQRVDVRVAPGDVDRGGRRSAEENGQIGWLDLAERLADVVETAVVIERRGG